MNASAQCTECAAELSADVQGGLCPKCLLSLGLSEQLDGLEPPLSGSSAPAADSAQFPIRNSQSAIDRIRYFGDYELLEEIARGGMGIVFKARQISLNRTVALKMIAAGQLASPELVARFHAEARAAATLDHPNIVPIFEIGEHAGQHYFSMPFIAGGSLAQCLAEPAQRNVGANPGPRGCRAGICGHGAGLPRPTSVDTQRKLARLVVTAASAVHYAHQRGILHRDLKPANILLDTDGQPHVTDFGLAKVLQEQSRLTVTQAILGTPSYMAPEQANGQAKEVTTAVDIYSLGAILYELLAGRPPFESPNPLETLLMVREREVVPPRRHNPLLDNDLEIICLKCLEKDPQQRYGSADALATDLERWLANEPIAARRSSAFQRTAKWVRRKPAHAGLLAAAFVTTVAVVVLAAGARYNLILKHAYDQARQAQASEAIERGRAEKALEAEAAQRSRAEAESERAKRAQATAEVESERARKAQAAEATERARAEAALKTEMIQRSRAEIESERASRNLYLASIAWADLARRNRSFEEADRILEETPPNLRNWEWSYLKRLCSSELQVFHGHRTNVIGIAFLNNSDSIVALGSDGRLIRWQVDTGVSQSAVQIWSGAPHLAVFSKDGSRLLKDGWGNEPIRVWDVASQKDLLAADCGFSQAPTAIALDPKGTFFAAASDDRDAVGTIRVWRTATGELVRTLKGNDVALNSIALSSDGTRLVAHETPAGNSGRLIVWNLQSGGDSRLGYTDDVFVDISPDARWVASVNSEASVKIWDAESGQLIHTVEDPEDEGARLPEDRPKESSRKRVQGIAFTLDSQNLVLRTDSKIILIDAKAGTVRDILRPPPWIGAAFAVRGDGRFVAGASREFSVSARSLIPRADFVSVRAAATGLAFSPNGKLLTSGDAVWSAADGQGKKIFSRGRAGKGRPAFSPDGKLIADNLVLRDAENGEAARTVEWASFWSASTFGLVYGAAISPDGRLLAAGKGNYGPGEIKLWDVNSGAVVQTLSGTTNPVWDVAFSPNGGLLASVSGAWGSYMTTGGPGEARLWNLRTGEPIRVHDARFCLYSICFSGDGQRYAAGGGIYHPGNKLINRGEIRVWEAQSGHEVFASSALSSCIYSVAMSPDGSRLVAAVGRLGESGPSDVKLWDVNSHREVLTLGTHDQKVYAVAFSPDGKRIASAGTEGTVKIWSIE